MQFNKDKFKVYVEIIFTGREQGAPIKTLMGVVDGRVNT